MHSFSKKRNSIEDAVEAYLATDDTYALLITGDWGSGKTYYFNNIVRPVIESKPLPNPPPNAVTLKHVVVPVSVFGLQSLEAIQEAIGSHLVPLLDKNNTDTVSSFANLLGKGAGDFVKDIGAKLRRGRAKPDNLKGFVIWFDDLERKGAHLSDEEFAGYINLLVESGVKVIITSNEEENKGSVFAKYKEKVIGDEVQYRLDLPAVYNSIVSRGAAGDGAYESFLIENRQFVFECFKSTNLRTLLRLIGRFRRVFYIVTKELSGENELPLPSKDLLLDLFKFTSAILIELKDGRFTLKDEEELKRLARQSMASLFLSTHLEDILRPKENATTEIGVSSSNAQHLVATYYGRSKVSFIQSLFDFIVGKSGLEAELFNEELKAEYHLESETNIVEPQYKLVNELTDMSVVSMMERADYLSKTKDLVHYAVDGKFELGWYPRVLLCAARFGNPLRLNLNKLVDRLLIGARKSVIHNKYNRYLAEELTYNSEGELAKYLQVLCPELIKLNQARKKYELDQVINEAISLLRISLLHFVDYVLQKEVFNQPLFKKMNFALLVKKVLKSPQHASAFMNIIMKRSTRFDQEDVFWLSFRQGVKNAKLANGPMHYWRDQILRSLPDPPPHLVAADSR